MSIEQSYLDSIIRIFKGQKKLAEKAMRQVEPAAFHKLLDAESTSLAIIIKHLSGNMRSRWRDFLTTDGEKPDRNRDSEFIDDFKSTEEVWQSWEAGWQVLLETLESLRTTDLTKTITIRAEPHEVIEAIQRQLSHYAYHVGQIVFLSRHLSADSWQTLSIAKGQSESYNQKMVEQEAQAFTKGSL